MSSPPRVPAPPRAAVAKPAHARLRRVLRHSPVMVWMSDETGAVTFVNRKWLTFTGRRLRDDLGDGWVTALHPEDVHACVTEFRAALATRRPFVVEYRLRRADSVYRWISDSGLP